MRKALNFDLNTKKYEKYCNKSASSAYDEIKKFLGKHNFEHRQWSGYVSKYSMSDGKISAIVENMADELIRLEKCIKQMDATNVGKQYSMLNSIHNRKKQRIKN